MEIIMKGYNLDSFKEKDIYSWKEIISKIEDLECELNSLKEEYEDFKKNVDENYEKISYSKQVEINDKDFI